MIPELGQFALILALLVAIVQSSLPLIGAWKGYPGWVALARPAAFAQLVLITCAFAALAWSLYAHDFSVLYVAQNSNSELPWFYRLTAVWGGHEGSLLLWIFVLSLWTVAVALFSRSLPDDFVARVLAVMGLITIGFLLFILFTSNPFNRVLPPWPDGNDLNPLLQDPGMIIHPPMLYMGYVGFSVPFAFAIAALLGGHLNQTWARWVRPWTAVAWGFLTFGIAIGSWWAYYELGWGGWWFWDPVENASFMPWLVGTALLHSLAVTERRGGFRGWTVLLAICAFSLSLLGTFLVRSGVLTSVHAFAQDPLRGMFILIFLGIVTGGALILYAIRAPRVAGGEPTGYFSRESLLLTNNLLFAAAAGMVLLGTLYPLVLEAMGLGRISVGAPYFGFMFTLLMTPIILLQPLGPFSRWGHDRPERVARQLMYVALVAIVLALVVSVALNEWSVKAIIGLLGGLWVILGALDYLWTRTRAGNNRLPPRGVIGMALAHLGVGVFLIGVSVTQSQSMERTVRMQAGMEQGLGPYTFRLIDVEQQQGPNYLADVGDVLVLRDGQVVTRLRPEKRNYGGGQVMTEAGIDGGLTRDLYVSLGEPLDGGAWSVRLYYKPFVRWIWGGAILMMAGAFFAASDPRYRRARKQARENRTLNAEPAEAHS